MSSIASDVIKAAARDAAENAAKDAIRVAARDAVENAAKDAIRAAAKDAAEQAAKDSVQAAAKDVVGNAAKDAVENATKDAAKQAAKDAAKAAAKDTAKTGLSKGTKVLIGLGVAGAAVGGGIAIDAKIKADKINGTKYNITSITTTTEGIEVKYSPSQKVNVSKDTIDLDGTDCTPSIDGKSISVVSSTTSSIVIKGDISSPGTKGNLKIHTSVEAQMENDGADVGNALSNGLGNTLDVLGIKPFVEKIFGSVKKAGLCIVICLILCILASIFCSVYSTFTSTSSPPSPPSYAPENQ